MAKKLNNTPAPDDENSRTLRLAIVVVVIVFACLLYFYKEKDEELVKEREKNEQLQRELSKDISSEKTQAKVVAYEVLALRKKVVKTQQQIDSLRKDSTVSGVCIKKFSRALDSLKKQQLDLKVRFHKLENGFRDLNREILWIKNGPIWKDSIFFKESGFFSNGFRDRDTRLIEARGVSEINEIAFAFTKSIPSGVYSARIRSSRGESEAVDINLDTVTHGEFGHCLLIRNDNPKLGKVKKMLEKRKSLLVEVYSGSRFAISFSPVFSGD